MKNIIKDVDVKSDEYWIWFTSKTKPDYFITGKYLFFSGNQERLCEIAQNEIKNYDFHLAKVNSQLLGSNNEYVLCLYYIDDSRKYELARRQNELYPDVKYRYWKSDKDTLKGRYSKQFLENLSEEDRKRFTKNKR